MDQPKSTEAQHLIAALDEELAAASKATGRELVWSAQEQDIISMLGAAVDRRVELTAEYKARPLKPLGDRMKLAAELRLLEASIARFHRQVTTDVPQPRSVTSMKNQRAANVRWNRERMAGNV